MLSVLVLVLMVSGVKVEKLQPVSVAGNPVGQCLSCKLLKIHPQFKMRPGHGAPEDNTQVLRYVYMANLFDEFQGSGKLHNPRKNFRRLRKVCFARFW